MEITKISEHFAVSAQIQASDIASLASAGFKSIICNRPDGEGEGQPTIAELIDAAAAHGIECCYLPVVPGQITEADVESFKLHTEKLQRPILGFCATGMRASTLWSSAQQQASGED